MGLETLISDLLRSGGLVPASIIVGEETLRWIERENRSVRAETVEDTEYTYVYWTSSTKWEVHQVFSRTTVAPFPFRQAALFAS